MMNIALASEKTDFNALIAAIPPTKNHALLFQNLVKINQDLVLPSNFQVQFTGNGAFEIASGKTVTIKGAVAAQPMNIFRGAGKVLLENSPLANVFPQWWGAVGDWTGGTAGTDNAAAFQKMQESLGASSNGARVLIPSGKYFFNTPLVLSRPITFIGGTSGTTSNVLFVFKDDSKGVEVSNNALGTLLKGLHIRTVNNNGGTSTNGLNGVSMQAKATLENCQVSGFRGDGIRVESSVSNNANIWQIRNVASKNNGQNGFRTLGANANAGLATSLDCRDNRENGIHDNSSAGNTYVGCHSQGNTNRNYRVTGTGNNTLFLGCFENAGASSVPNRLRIQDNNNNEWSFGIKNPDDGTFAWDLNGTPQAYGFTNSSHGNPGHMMLFSPMANSKHWYSEVKQNAAVTVPVSDTEELNFDFNDTTFFSGKSNTNFVANIELRTTLSGVKIISKSYNGTRYRVVVQISNTSPTVTRPISANSIRVAGFFIGI